MSFWSSSKSLPPLPYNHNHRIDLTLEYSFKLPPFPTLHTALKHKNAWSLKNDKNSKTRGAVEVTGAFEKQPKTLPK